MTPNPQQQEVIDHFEGPCLVMAVPGSGKTASVTERIKKLVQRGVEPKKILAITFTNKAAKEMRDRIGQAVGIEIACKMTISTFHSLCARIIRANCELLGMNRNFSIYDDDDREKLLKSCIKKTEDPEDILKFKPTKEYFDSLNGYLEGQRNACLTEYEATKKYIISGNQPKVIARYFSELKKSNAVDFTGLLSETLRLFKEYPAVRDLYRSRFLFISVDEVQDTNIVQYEIIKELGCGHKNILVVGDLDQSIYKFRDANPENILQFEKDFSVCKFLKLEKNYRSTPSILKHSQRLIEHNSMRKATSLYTDNLDGVAPTIISSKTDTDMAAEIATNVATQIENGVIPKEIVILYRTNYASRVLEQALRNRQIKYKIIGGLSFWERKEIKGAISILKLKCNNNDRMALEKTIEVCCRGVGEKAIGAINEMAQTKGLSVLDAARQFSTNKLASSRSLVPFITSFDESHNLLPGQGLVKLAQSTAFWDRIELDSTDTNDRCGNILEMARDVDDYCSKGNNTLAGYLQNLSLIQSGDEDQDETHLVKLMTLHGCKGLEFNVVFISHCIAELLPHARSIQESSNDEEIKSATEEERRLLYVGMTRAKKRLALFFCNSKIDARSRAPKQTFPSPFLFETGIPFKYSNQQNHLQNHFD